MNALELCEPRQQLPAEPSVSLQQRRGLGAFYTPSSVTNVLCDWAIRSAEDVILEPSFGGCTFLESSINRIEELGKRTAANLYGCDIDPNAFRFLKEKISSVCAQNFLLRDFLLWDPATAPGPVVDAVIGNPPYVRYSKLSPENQETVRQWEEKYGIRLSRRASLWVYFTYHALKFLREGARMAWVLPISLMTAKYADELKALLCKKFKRIAFFPLTERIFLSEGTEERALIVLAEDFSLSAVEADVVFQNINTSQDLREAIEQWAEKREEERSISSTRQLENDLDMDIAVVSKNKNVHLLGQLANVSIGVVSGNSRYFVRSLAEWRGDNIQKSHLTYIAPKSYWLPGIVLSQADKESHEYSSARCFALSPPIKPKAESLLRYLEKYREEEIEKNSTFKKRANWFRFLDDRVPHAFFVFMTDFGPRLVLNNVGADATNSLYRVEFKTESSLSHKLIAISLQTSFTQLAAERAGRALGSGALKLEPRNAKTLPLYLPKKTDAEIDTAFDVVDRHLRAGETAFAKKFANEFIFSESKQLKAKALFFDEHLAMARIHRRRIRQS